jgi:adenylosuccinate lyase
MAAGKQVKEEGLDNDLIERIASDPMFDITASQISEILVPEKYIGRSAAQVREFIDEYINPLLEANKDILGETAEISV